MRASRGAWPAHPGHLPLDAACYRAGDFEAAARELDRPGNSGGHAFSSLFLAMARARLGKLDAARAAIDAASATLDQPRSPQAAYLPLRDEARSVLSTPGLAPSPAAAPVH